MGTTISDQEELDAFLDGLVSNKNTQDLPYDSILVDDVIFDCKVKLEKVPKSLKEISFHLCTFNHKLAIENTALTLDFMNCSFNSSVRIHKVDCKLIEFCMCFMEDVIVDHAQIHTLNFSPLLALKKIEFWTNKIGRLCLSSYDRPIIDELSLECNSILEFAEVQGFNISYLFLHNWSTPSFTNRSIEFKNLNITTLHLNRIDSADGLKFYNTKAYENNSIICVNNSILKSSRFMNVNFDSYNVVLFINSYLSESKFVSCKWSFKNISLSEKIFIPVDVEGYHSYQRSELRNILAPNARKGDQRLQPILPLNFEVLKQLKYAYASQGDKEKERLLHALEWTAGERLLSWRRNFSAKLILSASKHLSNFGLSLGRPMITLLLLSLPYLLLLLTGNIEGVYFVGWQEANWGGLWNGLAQYLNIINPLHKTPEKMTGWPFIIDLLIRVISSYAIYNIVRASRRFIN